MYVFKFNTFFARRSIGIKSDQSRAFPLFTGPRIQASRKDNKCVQRIGCCLVETCFPQRCCRTQKRRSFISVYVSYTRWNDLRGLWYRLLRPRSSEWNNLNIVLLVPLFYADRSVGQMNKTKSQMHMSPCGACPRCECK